MVPSYRGCLQKCSNHTVENKIRSHRPEASPEDYGLCTQPDHGFCRLLRNPLQGFKGQACLLKPSLSLSSWQKVSKLIHHPGLGDQRPIALMDAMLALLPEDEKPGCLFQGLFLERLPVKMRDHLVSREFKNPSESHTLATP